MEILDPWVPQVQEGALVPRVRLGKEVPVDSQARLDKQDPWDQQDKQALLAKLVTEVIQELLEHQVIQEEPDNLVLGAKMALLDLQDSKGSQATEVTQAQQGLRDLPVHQVRQGVQVQLDK
jgi:hypothetical protein